MNQSPPIRFGRLAVPVVILTGLIHGPVLYAMIRNGYDYQVHMEIAVQTMLSGRILVPHFLLHLGIIAGSLFAPGAVPRATFLVLLLAIMATGAIVARMIHREGQTPATTTLMTIALLLAAPVAILAPLDRHLYLGYISTNVFHNPTMLLLKPLALVSFILTVGALENRRAVSASTLAVFGLATIGCALTKPNFTICLLPAAVALIAIRMVLKQPVNLKLLLIGLIVPAVASLVIQFTVTYGENQLQGVYAGKSDIILAPLAVMRSYSSWLFPKLLLSLAFPAAVLATHARKALKDPGMQLCWLSFGAGAVYTYLFAEAGPRMFQGNFTWSAQITLFVLFVYSAAFLCRTTGHPETGDRKTFFLCNALLLLHTLFGAVFYLSEFLHTERYW